MNTNIAIEMPEDIARVPGEKWGDLSQYAVEALAIEGYRSSALSTAQIRRMLGFQTRMEVDAFLKLHGVYRDYSEADLNRDIKKLRYLQRYAMSAAAIEPPPCRDELQYQAASNAGRPRHGEPMVLSTVEMD